ncbi:gfo/Idh/MocA family oxidoreductase [Psychrobacillus psychrodurans]|uniref:Gfo/Idh/MocA family protein n=1 Tax=Psychrobacillus psychrodurans TaxID=126157 RepID=UPI001F4E5298|nr:gfo/Idh/MocA family oxidoreductase [Psychrobacillus psychrodurans]MCK1995983.1 gfo/Idh/MocA family oxidoreductase [Psychrobacillus psychrodurans]
MNNYKCLVIGYGSIGQRHTRLLNELGHHVAVVSGRKVNYPHLYIDIKEALLVEQPSYIVIANETSKHEATLNEIKRYGYDQKILIEKPLFPKYINSDLDFSSMYVGYNLRFHPLVQTLFKELRNSSIVSVQCYVGQYLPSWRPGTDYTQSYSASASKGGGVLRDLSHELDFLHFLFGEWEQITAFGGKFSQLKIDSDDHFSFIYHTKQVPLVTLQMNYLDRIVQRMLIINTDKLTYKADFIQNTLQVNDKLLYFNVERDDTYKKQHLAILNGENEFLCSYENGLSIVKMIEKAEQASKEKAWVANE